MTRPRLALPLAMCAVTALFAAGCSKTDDPPQPNLSQKASPAPGSSSSPAVTVRMSGQFHRATGRVALPPHTHVVLTFQQGGDLRFVDPRTFGEMFVATADEVGKIKELQHIAIDPLDQVFTWPTFQYLLAQRASKMKPLLMDQKFISGLGNIYSDEVLFHAGLRYDRMSDTLSSQEVRRLYRAIQEILQEAIKARGTTLDDEAYVDLFGKPGEYGSELKVYGREGLPCRRCRTPIETIKIAQRSTFYCPQCQS